MQGTGFYRRGLAVITACQGRSEQRQVVEFSSLFPSHQVEDIPAPSSSTDSGMSLKHSGCDFLSTCFILFNAVLEHYVQLLFHVLLPLL